MKIKYTKHAKDRMEERFITHKDILNVLEEGRYMFLGNREFEVKKGRVRLIVAEGRGNNLRVVTVTYTTEYNKEIKRYAIQNNLTVTEATKIYRELKPVI